MHTDTHKQTDTHTPYRTNTKTHLSLLMHMRINNLLCGHADINGKCKDHSYDHTIAGNRYANNVKDTV